MKSRRPSDVQHSVDGLDSHVSGQTILFKSCPLIRDQEEKLPLKFNYHYIQMFAAFFFTDCFFFFVCFMSIWKS